MGTAPSNSRTTTREGGRSSEYSFTKYEGLGNDFIVVEVAL
jgi:hypothetical protein